MSDARAPAAGTTHLQNPARGRRSEQNQPVSDARAPAAGTTHLEHSARGRRSEQNQPVSDARAPAHCDGDVCITCSDEAVPVRVVEMLGNDLAMVDTGVSEEEVSVALVDAGPGDTILVHAKEALTVIRRTRDGS